MKCLLSSTLVTTTVLFSVLLALPRVHAVLQDSKNQPMQRPGEILRDRGVDNSGPSLVAALQDSRADIRSLAAQTLADNHIAGASTLIEHALSRESDPSAKLGMSVALISLNNAVGSHQLQQMCSDSSMPVRFLIEAVQTLEMAQASIRPCSDALLIVLARSKMDDRAALASLIPALYGEATTDTAKRALTFLHRWVTDKSQEPAVRIASGNALAQIGDPSSLQVVRDAVATEKDPTILSSLRQNVAELETKQ
jgi:hypothetical protein